MSKAIRILALAALVVGVSSLARAADTFTVDPVHSSISFMISHSGISNIHGRFNDYSGKFVIDKDDPSKSKFSLSIKIDTIDTNNAKRDEHLRAPDYFNSKQFPTMDFESTKVKAIKGGYDVTGDLTMHGVKKPVSFTLKGGEKLVEFPPGKFRLGFSAALSVKRSAHDLTASLDSLGDDIPVTIDLQVVKE